MKKLTVNDFEQKSTQMPYYFSYTEGDDLEICIEPCLNGYDVAIYSRKRDDGFGPDLLRPKFCTNMNMISHSPLEALEILAKANKLALSVANNFYKDYQLKQNSK